MGSVGIVYCRAGVDIFWKTAQNIYPKEYSRFNINCLVVVFLFFIYFDITAVILPTAYLYINERFGAEPWLLGFLLSAFSLSGMLASPIMGRWSDVTGNTKIVILVANLFEIAGSIMYFLGLNKWFLVASRFIAGIGTGAGSAIMADITRVTSVEERTAVMSLFMAIRQFGLLLGPGCNLFLRELHFYIGPYIVDKYTAPGIFMACLWLLLEITVIFMYWNLPTLKNLEELEKEQEESAQTEDDRIKQSPVRKRFLSRDESTNPEQESSSQYSINGESSSASSNHIKYPVEINNEPRVRHPHLIDRSDLTASSEMIETAERFMGGPPGRASVPAIGNPREFVERCRSQSLDLPGSQSGTDDIAPPQYAGSTYGTTTPTDDMAPPQYAGSTYGTTTPSYSNSLHTTSQQTIPNNISSSHPETSVETSPIQVWTWRFFYDEYVREEIVAILATVFVAFFNQVAIETMATPLTKTLLDWGEVENSLLYCAAGIEILLVFLFIRCVSSRVSDRYLILSGFIVETVTVIFMLWFVPQAKPNDLSKNLPCLIVGVFMDVCGIPFLAVTSTSLYSKITRPETQGLSQGLRRICVNLGTILGPLWAGNLMNRWYIMFGVMLGINASAMVMLLLSFKYLKVSRPSVRSNEQNEIVVSADETTPLLREENA